MKINQKFLGRRDLLILDNNSDINKPLRMRERSPVDSESDTRGVVGYMGDDEDIEQAKYDVIKKKFDTMKSLFA